MVRIDTIRYTHGMSKTRMLVIGGSVVLVLAVLLGVAIGVPLSQRSGDRALDTARKVLSEVPLVDG